MRFKGALLLRFFDIVIKIITATMLSNTRGYKGVIRTYSDLILQKSKTVLAWREKVLIEQGN